MVRDDALTLLNAKSPAVVALSNNTVIDWTWNSREQWYNSSLAGLVMLSSAKWESYVVSSREKNAPQGSKPVSTAAGSAADAYRDYKDYKAGECMSYLDPQDDVLEDLNRLMFYAGYVAGTRSDDKLAAWFISQLEPGLEANPSVVGYLTGSENVYQTNLRWFAAAAGLEVVCIAMILPTFIGWWRLGR